MNTEKMKGLDAVMTEFDSVIQQIRKSSAKLNDDQLYILTGMIALWCRPETQTWIQAVQPEIEKIRQGFNNEKTYPEGPEESRV